MSDEGPRWYVRPEHLLARNSDAVRARGVHRAKRSLKKIHGHLSCAVCKWRMPTLKEVYRHGDGVQGHHVVPVSAGGSSDSRNILMLCPNHHAVAHALGKVAYMRNNHILTEGQATDYLRNMLTRIDEESASTPTIAPTEKSA